MIVLKPRTLTSTHCSRLRSSFSLLLVLLLLIAGCGRQVAVSVDDRATVPPVEQRRDASVPASPPLAVQSRSEVRGSPSQLAMAVPAGLMIPH